MMSDYQRLHPAAILFTAARSVRESIIPIAAGVYVTFEDGFSIYAALALTAFFIILITFSIASWYRFSYRVEDDELRIEHGIFIRRKRYISKNRIQSIDLTSGVIHRMFRLVQVQIDTAGSGAGSEAFLKAVSLTQGEKLRAELKTMEAANTEEDEPAADVMRKQITIKELFITGSTSGSAGVILTILIFSFFKIEQFIPDRIYNSTLEWVISLSIAFIIVLAVAVLVLIWLFGIAGTMIKYGNFTITQNGDELLITRGLLEKKQITIPLRRIQAVGIAESVIRQPIGYVTVFAEVAGGSLERGEAFSTVLFPVMKASEAEGFLKTFLPDYAERPETFTPLPRRAAAFYVLRTALFFLILTVVTTYFLPQFTWVALLLLLASAGLGFLQYKDAGYRLRGHRLTLRSRGMSRQTITVYKKRIQAFERKQHRLQRMQKLATMTLSIVGIGGSGRHYSLKHMSEEKADEQAAWYSRMKR